MDFPISTLFPSQYPASLLEIPKPPAQLYFRGTPTFENKRFVAFVGARQHTDYGKEACERIISELASYPIVIVSGLAIGIDAIAHGAALAAGLSTIAVIGSGLHDSVLYPKTNHALAQRILERGGGLLSELPAMTRASKYSFPARNRIIAGMCDVIVAVECELKSGTRITTRLGVEYGKDVGAIPHTIFSETGAGCNALISQGAYAITSGCDVLELLDMSDLSLPVTGIHY